MTENTTITIRADKKLKREAEEILEDIGLNMTAAFTIYLKKIVREKRIPFEIGIDPFYGKANQEHVNNAVKRFKNGEFKPNDIIMV